jgi:hypothetical protein
MTKYHLFSLFRSFFLLQRSDPEGQTLPSRLGTSTSAHPPELTIVRANVSNDFLGDVVEDLEVDPIGSTSERQAGQ